MMNFIDKLRALCLDKHSHFAMNRFTLSVYDAKISKMVKQQNTKNFRALTTPAMALSALFALSKLIDFVTSDEQGVNKLIFGFSHFVTVLLWWLVDKKHPYQAPKMIFPYMLFWCVTTNLSFRDSWPEVFHEKDKSSDENSILVTLIMCHICNYTSFLTTLLLQPTIIVVGYYYQVQI